ncbi:hypothetical protein SDC9_123529 [bioreactor metagenome]|uniref:Uncharacterized protein n=1 Tax=bioreactor metagenome TaxID=1076179 RepID=A0A645CHW5_9ZZZZ
MLAYINRNGMKRKKMSMKRSFIPFMSKFLRFVPNGLTFLLIYANLVMYKVII